MDSEWTTARRVKAARALAGYRNTRDLATSLGPGLSDKTLRKIESEHDPRQAKSYELEAIAQACGVSPAFFTVNFADLGSAGSVGVRFGELAKALAPEVPEDQLARIVYEVLGEVTEDFAQAAATVLARRLKEAGLNPGAQGPPGERPVEGDRPRDRLRFDPDRPPSAEAPPEGTRHAS